MAIDTAPATERMGDAEFESLARIAWGVSPKMCDPFFAEARRAREREKAMEKALWVIVDGIGDSDHMHHCRLYRRIAREALEEKP